MCKGCVEKRWAVVSVNDKLVFCESLCDAPARKTLYWWLQHIAVA